MVRLALALVFLTPVPLLAQRGPYPTGQPTGVELEIHNTFDTFVAAWNQHDAGAMAAMWTSDGDYMEPDGRTVFGRDEVKRLLTYEHASVFKSSQLLLAIERVRSPAKSVAIADGTYELFGATDTKGNKIPTRSGYFTSVLTRGPDGWRVSANRLMLPQVLIWRDRE